MKQSIVICALLLVVICSYAQDNPVTWTFDADKDATGNYSVNLKATVAAPWHIYSQTTPKGGPIPTKINFKLNPLVSLTSKVSERGDVKKIHDENFGVDVIYFAGDAKFVQNVKVKTTVKTKLSGTVEYMVCNDYKCLPPVIVPFEVTLN